MKDQCMDLQNTIDVMGMVSKVTDREIVNQNQVLMTIEDIYLGPQRAAAAMMLLDRIKQWFQV